MSLPYIIFYWTLSLSIFAFFWFAVGYSIGHDHAIVEAKRKKDKAEKDKADKDFMKGIPKQVEMFKKLAYENINYRNKTGISKNKVQNIPDNNYIKIESIGRKANGLSEIKMKKLKTNKTK